LSVEILVYAWEFPLVSSGTKFSPFIATERSILALPASTVFVCVQHVKFHTPCGAERGLGTRVKISHSIVKEKEVFVAEVTVGEGK